MIEIIPAIDIIDGKCVRLSQGDYGQKTIYNENPLEVAKMFEDAGLKRLHLVDLDGAKAHRIVNQHILQIIASRTGLIIDFGGGLKSDEDLRIAFESGASMVTGGSIAVKSPETFMRWIEKFGAEKIILGADAKNEMIAVTGWQESTGIDIYSFINNKWVILASTNLYYRDSYKNRVRKINKNKFELIEETWDTKKQVTRVKKRVIKIK